MRNKKLENERAKYKGAKFYRISRSQNVNDQVSCFYLLIKPAKYYKVNADINNENPFRETIEKIINSSQDYFLYGKELRDLLKHQIPETKIFPGDVPFTSGKYGEKICKKLKICIKFTLDKRVSVGFLISQIQVNEKYNFFRSTYIYENNNEKPSLEQLFEYSNLYPSSFNGRTRTQKKNLNNESFLGEIINQQKSLKENDEDDDSDFENCDEEIDQSATMLDFDKMTQNKQSQLFQKQYNDRDQVNIAQNDQSSQLNNKRQNSQSLQEEEDKFRLKRIKQNDSEIQKSNQNGLANPQEEIVEQSERKSESQQLEEYYKSIKEKIQNQELLEKCVQQMQEMKQNIQKLENQIEMNKQKQKIEINDINKSYQEKQKTIEAIKEENIKLRQNQEIYSQQIYMKKDEISKHVDTIKENIKKSQENLNQQQELLHKSNLELDIDEI